jgi:hypothetical protein
VGWGIKQEQQLQVKADRMKDDGSIMDQQAQIVRVNKREKFLYDPKPQLIVTWVKQCEKLLLLTLAFFLLMKEQEGQAPKQAPS